MKRRIRCVLVCILAMFLFCPHVQAEEVDDTISIYTAQEFLSFAKDSSYDAYTKGKTFVLKKDISLDGTDFTQVPVFCGTFDGEGHTISGAALSNASSPAGLFGIIEEEGTVKDLKVSSAVTPSQDTSAAGGIAGINYGTIQNCSFMGSIEGKRNTGGITGINASSGYILNCDSSGVIYGQTMTGGITGYNNGIISGCTNSALVNTNADDSELTVNDLSTPLSLDFESTKAETSTIVRMDTGGIAGYSAGSISLCRNEGTIGYAQVGYNAGGIAGRNSGFLTGCTNTGTVNGRKDIGGIAGQAEPHVNRNISASDAAILSSQLDQMSSYVASAQSHADAADAALNQRLNDLSTSVSDAKNSLDSMHADVQNQVTDAQDKINELDDEAKQEIQSEADAIGNTDPDEIRKRAEEAIPSAIPSFDPNQIQKDLQDETDKIRYDTEQQVNQAAQQIRSIMSSGLDALQEIDQNTAGSNLNSSISDIYAQSQLLQQEAQSRGSQLVQDAQNISSQIRSISATLNNALYTIQHPENLVQDTSENEIDSVLLGKILSCQNTGEINGTLNTGGITGSMALESTSDPEDDVSLLPEDGTKETFELKCILQNSKNTGTVNGVRNDIGGICGRMDIGLIISCENYGDVSSSSGSEIGGIAGIAGASVRNNDVKCHLSGSNSVGGIAGNGVSSTVQGYSSVISGNVSMVVIDSSGQGIGAICGENHGTFEDNIFVSDDLNGINGVSYEGKAQPVSYYELRNRENLPDEFRSFTLRFVADGETLKTVNFQYGDSFDQSVYPNVPAKDGEYVVFHPDTLANLHFDTVVTAEYQNHRTALSSSETRNNGRSVFYVKGNFDDTSEFSAVPVSHTPQDFHLVSQSFWNAFADYLSHPGQGLAFDLMEQWQLQIPDDGNSSHQVRYLLPSQMNASYQIYASENGSWKKCRTEENGSYAVFETDGNNVQIALIACIPGWWIYALIGGIALVVLLALLRVKRRDKRKATREAIRRRIARDRRLKYALIVLVAFNIAILGAGFYFIHHGIADTAKAYQTVKEFASKEDAAIDLDLNVTVGSESTDKTIHLQRASDHITAVSSDDLTVYYGEDTVYLANGRAYQISGLLPDYGTLLEAAADLYEDGEIETSQSDGKTVYKVTAQQEKAEKVLRVLLSSHADELPSVKSLDASVTSENNELEEISFHSAGVLKDDGNTAYTVDATMHPVTSTAPRVPDAVLEASENKVKGTETITSDYIDLLEAYASLDRSENTSSRIHLVCDSDLLQMDDVLQFHRSYNNGNPISSIQKNDKIIYFTSNKICDSDGSTVSTEELRKLGDTGKLPDAVYSISMNGDFDISSAGNSRVYTLSLDQNSMNQLADILLSDLPEADPRILNSGIIQIVMNDTSITRVTITLNGSLNVLDQEKTFSVSADASVSEDESFSIPDKVLKALAREDS